MKTVTRNIAFALLTVTMNGFVIFSAHAKQKNGASGKNLDSNIEYVYSCISPSLSITDLEFTDSATNVYLRYKGTPGEKVNIPPYLYIVDSECQIHGLLSSSGLKPGVTTTCPFNGDLEFMLSFEKISQKDKAFDLLSLSPVKRRFGFWGIHTKSSKPKMKRMPNDKIVSNDTDYIRKGSITVRGSFTTLSEGLVPDSIRLKYAFLDRNSRQNEYTQVGNDGKFEITGTIDGITWAYLNLPKQSIPVMLFPDDTLEIVIDNHAYPVCRATQKSAHGNDGFNRLMQADPIADCRILREQEGVGPFHPETLERIDSTARSEYAQLLQYLTWKYKLNAMEQHLLNEAMQAEVDFYRLRCLCELESLFFVDRSECIVNEEQLYIPALEAMKVQMKFVRNTDYRDLSLFSLPDGGRLKCLYYTPFLSFVSIYPTGYLNMQRLLKEFLGEDLPEVWMDRLCYFFPGRKEQKHIIYSPK